jgi:uncharacterized tellurite resistance protein B-like protein
MTHFNVMFLERLSSLFTAPSPATRPDARAAVAELLVHASMIDGHLDESEIKARDRLLKDKFGIGNAELETLVAEAEAEYEDAIDFYRFTSAIKDAYDRDQRETIVEMLCEILLADGVITNEEMNMGWRIAGLLGFDNREWVTIRKRVEDRLSA